MKNYIFPLTAVIIALGALGYAIHRGPMVINLNNYDCVIMTGHGVQARLTVMSTSKASAEKSAEEVRLKLVAKGVVGDNTGVVCMEQEPEVK